MEIHFQTTDHVVAVENVAEQHIGTKYSKCDSLRVISHIIILGKSAITHSKVGQSSPPTPTPPPPPPPTPPTPPHPPKKKILKSLKIHFYQTVTVVVSEKTA